MFGSFERGVTAYPYGFLKSDEGYRITDMRTLEPLSEATFPVDQAEVIASKVNHYVRQGEDPHKVFNALTANLRDQEASVTE